MDKKFTPKEIAKIFALYFPLRPVFEREGSTGNVANTEAVKVYSSGLIDDRDYKLPLTPLSAICDKDCIEVAKAAGYYVGTFEPEYIVSVIKNIIKAVMSNFSNDATEFSNITSLDLLAIYDRLRELGYSLPYKGIDLFEAGIAIEKK